MAALLAEAEHRFPGGSNGNSIYQDVVISHGKGSRIFDADGKEYVDYVMGGGPMMLGHAHPAIIAAVAERMPLGPFRRQEAVRRATPSGGRMPLRERRRAPTCPQGRGGRVGTRQGPRE